MIKIPDMKTEKIKIDEIKPYSKNSKKHPKEQVEKIKKSLTEFGFRWPIMLNNPKEKEIIAGHGRVIAAKELGMKVIPVIYAGDLSKKQVIAFRIMDNKSNESEWDMDFLKEDLEILKQQDFDMELTGFTQEDFDESFKKVEFFVKEKEIDHIETDEKCPKCGYRW